jgi:hypothetical protein
MSGIRSITRNPTVKGSASGASAPIYVDSDDNILKMIPAGSGTTEVQLVDASSTQTLTTKTLTAPTITSPTVTGTVAGAATYTTPKIAEIDDTAGTNRALFNATAKTIVDGSATGLFSVAVPAGPAAVGGSFVFLVRASDGTEIQAISGIATYSGVAKTTTVIGTVTYVTANEAKAVSSGTLTLAFTADVSVASVLTIKVQPTGSLTETTPYTIEYTMLPVRGVVTIL